VGEPNRNAATASLTYAGSLKIRGQVRPLVTNREPDDFRVAPANPQQPSSAVRRSPWPAKSSAGTEFEKLFCPKFAPNTSLARISHHLLSQA
jgi:hypothetical protein